MSPKFLWHFMFEKDGYYHNFTLRNCDSAFIIINCVSMCEVGEKGCI